MFKEIIQLTTTPREMFRFGIIYGRRSLHGGRFYIRAEINATDVA